MKVEISVGCAVAGCEKHNGILNEKSSNPNLEIVDFTDDDGWTLIYMLGNPVRAYCPDHTELLRELLNVFNETGEIPYE